MDSRLLEAAVTGNKGLLLELLQEDADVLERAMRECTGKDDNLLHLGALYGHGDLVREILSRKPEFARELNSRGLSPLHVACARGHVGVVREILYIDADACLVRDRDGRIPLHVAAIKGQTQVLEELLKADKATAFLLTDTDREEPILHLCANNKQFKALKMLVALVGDDANFVNLKDADGNNILHLLSAEKEFMMIRFLAKRTRVDTNALNASNLTPLDVSLKNANNGFFGWITDWALMISGAKTRSTFTFKQMTKIVNSYHRSWLSEALLVVAVLMITVAFQAGLNPPGGVWQDTGYHNATSLSVPNARELLVHHYAGQSVMFSLDPYSYSEFSNYNRQTISTSMLVMILLLVRCFIRSWFLNVLPIIFTSWSIWAMSNTYDTSSYFITKSFAGVDRSYYTYESVTSSLPEALPRVLLVFMLIAAAPFLAVILLTAHTAIIWTRKVIGYAFKKFRWAFLEAI